MGVEREHGVNEVRCPFCFERISYERKYTLEYNITTVLRNHVISKHAIEFIQNALIKFYPKEVDRALLQYTQQVFESAFYTAKKIAETKR